MNYIALPILVPLAFIISFILIKNERYVRWLSVFGSVILLVVSVFLLRQVIREEVLVLHMGGWKAPYGIALVIDYLGAIMLLVTALLMLTISIYAIEFVKNEISYSRFSIFFYSLIMGVNGAFITADVFNLYVWFELMLLSSFVLITMGAKKEQLEGGIKYLALNLIGSLLFLAGLGLLYGKTGTLNMAHLAQILIDDDQSILMNTSAVLFFVAFGIKAAVFPLFFWLPSSYHTPNITVTTLFAGLLTKVGVYALIRFFTLFFVQDTDFWHNLLLVVAGLTMVIGGMAASAHYETRKILSYHIISQIGYMLMGLGIFTPLGIAGAIYFMVHNMIAKTNTFMVAGLISQLKGTFYLKSIGGLFKQAPFVAILFIIPAFALAGIPPLSGFFAKFILIKAGIEDGHYIVTIVAVLTGLLTLYSMIKIWNEAFLKKQPKSDRNEKPVRLSVVHYLPSIILALVTIMLGVFAGPSIEFFHKVASQLINPEAYIQAVLKL
ncbi:MAG: hypothetical protein MI922_30070 [Bacteroidales bacterium]|nr:hypothetical protein [Bacteroidales bacterium]